MCSITSQKLPDCAQARADFLLRSFIRKAESHGCIIQQADISVAQNHFLCRCAIRNKELYVHEIEQTAKELGVTLRWYSSRTEFLNLLPTQPNGKQRTGCTKIAQFVYYGHGYIGELWITYGGGGNINKEIVTAKEFPEGIFQFHPVIQLYSCHSASKKKNSTQKSIAEELYDELMKKSLSVVVVGFNGRVDYVPVAEGKHPTGGTSVSKDTVVDLSLIYKEDTYNYYYYKNIKPEIFGS